MEERLQKILSQWGVASRREAEQIILDKRVRVNGTVVQLGQKADPETDTIEVDGKPIHPANRPRLIYWLLHKPAGVLSTCTDPQHRPTVLDLLATEDRQKGLHPVGRLDINTTGALLITNDGRLTFWLTHPRHHIPKTYRVWVQGHPSELVLQAWREGVMLSGRLTLPAQISLIEQRFGVDAQTCLEITLTEGRNRQIRRVAEQLGFPVLHLHRTAIGPVQLQPANESELPSGHYRPLMATELEFLRNFRCILLANGKSVS